MGCRKKPMKECSEPQMYRMTLSNTIVQVGGRFIRLACFLITPHQSNSWTAAITICGAYLNFTTGSLSLNYQKHYGAKPTSMHQWSNQERSPEIGPWLDDYNSRKKIQWFPTPSVGQCPFPVSVKLSQAPQNLIVHHGPHQTRGKWFQPRRHWEKCHIPEISRSLY